jgi:hypothetical protein
VLLKPYSFDELLETVEKVLRATVIASAEIEPPQSMNVNLGSQSGSRPG